LETLHFSLGLIENFYDSEGKKERERERRNKERKRKKFWGGRDSDKLLLILGQPESVYDCEGYEAVTVTSDAVAVAGKATSDKEKSNVLINVTLRRVRRSAVAIEKQYLLHILSVCL